MERLTEQLLRARDAGSPAAMSPAGSEETPPDSLLAGCSEKIMEAIDQTYDSIDPQTGALTAEAHAHREEIAETVRTSGREGIDPDRSVPWPQALEHWLEMEAEKFAHPREELEPEPELDGAAGTDTPVEGIINEPAPTVGAESDPNDADASGKPTAD
jgi:hypothetical protein